LPAAGFVPAARNSSGLACLNAAIAAALGASTAAALLASWTTEFSATARPAINMGAIAHMFRIDIIFKGLSPYAIN
jgi:hypothetical protein